MPTTPHHSTLSPTPRRRVTAGAAGLLSLLLALSACGSSTSEGATATTSTDVTTEVLTAEEGAIARAELAAATARGGAAASSLADSMPIECGTGGEPYVPTAEELASVNGDAEALATTLDTYGIAYEKLTDDLGFVSVVTDWNDAVAQAVVDSFWADRYQPEPLPAEEVARIQAENDKLAAALDGVGATYTRQTDRWGNEWIEWDYSNADAQAAVDAVYAELYPPVPPTAEELAAVTTENDRIAAAFDAAGIAYTRQSDAAGWEWIEWDYEDPSIMAAVDAVFAELYPVDPTVDPMPCPLVDDAATSGVAESGTADTEASSTEADDTEASSTEEMTIDPIAEITPEQEAQRAADIDAMVAGFTAAGVDHWVVGEAPWTSLTFDIANAASVGVIQGILAARG